ncbi:hypothetical protein [Pontiella agarivorans]|uniref:Uncharacterized protein n=1 Tax=Pontiella agarivorans TaxID=3038953 RepID=A0ABU5MVB6_9BACT|nr:hypothetical protein [Pontiella agarivorans]MDZ8118174.1 hypothetical protein [Pontiella agarivorans]
MIDRPTHRYGTFILAAAVYVAGVILFSLWSFNAHSRALHNYVDKALVDAAFALEELLNCNALTELEQNASAENTEFVVASKQLERVALHGNFSAVLAGTVRQNQINIIISGSTESRSEQRSLAHELLLTEKLKNRILQMAAEGRHATEMFTTIHPAFGKIRYALIYKPDTPEQGHLYATAQESRHIEQQLGNQLLRMGIAAIGMLLLAIPLITLFNRTQRLAARHLTELNNRLQNDVDSQRAREEELKDAIKDLERFNAVSAGRESRIIELKAEVNDLLKELKRDKRYTIDKID